MLQQRAYRYRVYPTAEQAAVLARTFGCVRYVYNYALRLRQDAYRERKQRLGYTETSAALPALKQQPDTAWLAEVSSVPLQQALRHLDRAYRNFFAGRAHYPRFKKKHGKQAATYASTAFTWDAATRTLTLAKMTDPLAIRWSRTFTGTPTSVTVSQDAAGRYFVAFAVEEEVEALPPLQAEVGVDLGLKDLVVLSTGEKMPHPKHYRRSARALAHAQRDLARKQRGSRNRGKARRKVARLHAHIAAQRLDALHKLTTRLVRENQTICVESLAVKQMLQHPTLAKSIADAGWGELVRQLEYTSRWYGRILVRLDRWTPSTKLCHECGTIYEEMDLSVRAWTCRNPVCGVWHDRDLNAAQNIRDIGLAGSLEAFLAQRAQRTQVEVLRDHDQAAP